MARLASMALLLTLVGTPLAAHAAFSFTEIMYDASGTDTKHEWVEVLNDSTAVDMTTYKFFENGSNHGLTLHSGSATVGGYAVIADDAATFLLDYPSYSGTLFDAAFSLSNTGESLTLRDGSLADVASATYSADAGAAGDGNTLNYVSGAWAARTPSPGAAASGGALPPTGGSSGTSSSGSSPSQSSSSGSGGAAVEEPKISVDAGADRTVVVGAGAVFTAVALGTKGDPLANARYVWNFGNAASKEGQSVLYAYMIPGTYVVTVDASSAGLGATDRITVTAVAAHIVVTRANETFIELENRSSHELDLGLWQVGVGKDLFVLPAHTALLPGKAVAFPKESTGLAPKSAAEVKLFYPNGALAAGAAPELSFVSDTAPVATHVSQPTATRVITSAPANLPETPEEKVEPRVLGASATAVTPTWAWVSFGFLAALVLAGVSTLAYMQFKR